MKRLILILAATVCAVAACTKEETAKENMTTDEDVKTFTAGMEGWSSETKTYYTGAEEGNLLWRSGDEVTVWEGSKSSIYKVSEDSGGKNTATLKSSTTPKTAGDKLSANVAFYYDRAASKAQGYEPYVEESDGVFTLSDVYFPPVQQYTKGSFADYAFPMVAVTTSSSDTDLHFKNICSVIKLTLTGTETVEEITFQGNNGEIIAGEAVVTASNSEKPTVTMSDNATITSIKLDCGDGVQLSSSGTSFYIVVPPVKMSKGFTFTITDTDGCEMTLTSSKSHTISRSTILVMPSLSYEPTPRYLTFISNGTSSVSLYIKDVVKPTLEYSYDKNNWTTCTVSSDSKGKAIYGSYVFSSDKPIYIRGNNPKGFSASVFDYARFNFSGDDVSLAGNIMSLISYEEDITEIPCSACFYHLFYGCGNIIDASELSLPATTLKSHCYAQMFFDCQKLVGVPDLPAKTLANCCYLQMFVRCYNVHYIKCLATDVSAANCTSNWLSEGASTGTFVKASSMKSWTTGTSGIPSGWTVVDAD